MDGLIDDDCYRGLAEQVKRLSQNDGIINQIHHLCYPDDNEIFEYVFEYLEKEINRVIKGWCDLKVGIQKISKRID